MNFSQIEVSVNRALNHSLSKMKVFVTFLALVICGMLVVFCRGASGVFSHWMEHSLTFLPLFFSTGVLFALGILLNRCYHDELKKKATNPLQVAKKSWALLLASAYFSVPVVLAYLALWLFLGLFQFLQEIPHVGMLFATLFSFAPFLLYLAVFVLALLSLMMLFFLSPQLALNGWKGPEVLEATFDRFRKNLFGHTLLLIVGALPLLFLSFLLWAAATLGGSFLFDTSAAKVLATFFIMIPFAALLAPGVLFFFNFALEAYLILKNTKEG